MSVDLQLLRPRVFYFQERKHPDFCTLGFRYSLEYYSTASLPLVTATAPTVRHVLTSQAYNIAIGSIL